MNQKQHKQELISLWYMLTIKNASITSKQYKNILKKPTALYSS